MIFASEEETATTTTYAKVSRKMMLTTMITIMIMIMMTIMSMIMIKFKMIKLMMIDCIDNIY